MAANEGTANNSGYDLIRKTFDLFEGVELWEARGSQDSAPYWVLCIPNGRLQHPDAYAKAISRLSALRNEPALLTLAANYEDDEHLCLVYERSNEWVPLQYLRQEDGTYPLWVMRATAELLESFYRRRLSGHFAGAGAIFVDEMRQDVRLAFMGLADIFTARGVMPSGFQGRRSWLDDVYGLGETFSQELESLGDETISRCLSSDPSNRPEYRELLKAMQDYEDFHPQYEEEMVMPLLDSSESTANNSGYDLIRKTLEIFEGIELWEAEDSQDFEPCWVLRISNRHDLNAETYERARFYLDQLRNDPSLLSFVDDYEDGKHLCFVYERSEEWVPLEDLRQSDGVYPLWIMRATAELLEDLSRRHLSGHFAGTGSIFVDKEHYKVRLAFMGLADIFTALEMLPSGSQGRRSWLDDVYELAWTFSEQLEGIGDQTIFNCLAPDPSDRPSYQEISKAMQNHGDFHPQYEEVVKLSFIKGKNEPVQEDINELLHCLNTHDCFISPWKVNEYEKEKKNKDQLSCDFQAGEFSGILVNEQGKANYFVPRFGKGRRKASGEILRARFEQVSKDIPNHEGKDQYHYLTHQNDAKDKILESWKRVPEQEKKHLQENQFKEKYIHVRKLEKTGIPKLSFLMGNGRSSNDKMKIKVDDMWKRSQSLEAVYFEAQSSSESSNNSAIQVGYVEDKPERSRLVIGLKNLNGQLRQKAQSGRLTLNEGNLRSFDYEFFWRSGGTCYFAISRKNEHIFDEIRAEISELLQHHGSDIEVLIESDVDVKGRLDSIQTCFEIVMRDFKNIPSYPGELYENISLEIIPHQRQIDAVEYFRAGEMVGPQFEKILLNPETHRAQLISEPFPESESQDGDGIILDSKQREAVHRALNQKPIFLIHGPPGTGKTKVIEEIIQRILAKDRRKHILVCSQTNLAVDNVLEKFKDSKKVSGVRPVRLAANESSVDPSVKDLWLDNRLRHWGQDAINRSNQYLGNLEEKESQERTRAIKKILKKYHQFLKEAGTDKKEKQCSIRGHVEYGWEPFKEGFLRSRNVIGATCIHIASSRYRNMFRGTFDFVIMDEASKATPAESLIPILRAKQLILVGDHKQLPPFVTSDEKVLEKVKEDTPDEFDYPDEQLRKKYGRSLFEHLIEGFCSEQDQLSTMLSVQRRMPKQMGDLISRHFYNNKLASDEELDKKKTAGPPLRFRRPTSIVFIDTSRHKDRCDNDSRRRRKNKCNARVITQTLKTLNRRLQSKKDIAVIAGYRGQVQLLEEKIHRLNPYKNLKKFKNGVPVKTVDGFQGRENDIVIFDVVRSAGGGKIGFLDDRRRLNVSLSRARELLIIVGDFEFLSKKAEPILDGTYPDDDERTKPLLGLIADEIKEQGCVFHSLEEALK